MMADAHGIEPGVARGANLLDDLGNFKYGIFAGDELRVEDESELHVAPLPVSSRTAFKIKV